MPEENDGLRDLQAMVDSTNIAESLDDDVLKEMGYAVCDWYDIDEKSRYDWEDKYNEYIKLATQVKEEKSFPWANASNVKYPLLTIAALQFSARAYQALVPTTKVVKARVVGADPEGQKSQRANRIKKFMSYQILEEIDSWEDDMDKLCMVLPIVGNMFKKTYYDGDKFVSEGVLPKDLMVNYYATSIEEASRKSHRLFYYPNEYISMVRSGDFLPLDIGGNKVKDVADLPMAEMPDQNPFDATDEAHGLTQPSEDPTTPHEYLECHCFWDLDDDGYEEPYIITVHKETRQVVRVVARYDVESVKVNAKNEIISIEPVEYFTNFIFIPDPNSGVYGLGFGVLLGPLNEATNTIINQLLDSGTINNMSSGFLSKGIRMEGGNTPLKPNEWRFVNSMGDDLRKGIVELPKSPPSPVLFQLLGTLLQSGQQLSSVSDMMTGDNPGQNQPFSTTSEVLSQGLQVFSSIYKRIHRSLRKEFNKLYRLNRLFLPEEKYFVVLDPSGVEDEEMASKIFQSDFNDKDIDIVPAADPRADQEAEKMAQMQTLMTFIQMGTVNPQVATKDVLMSGEYDNIEALLQVPEPQPSFEEQIKMQELELAKHAQQTLDMKTEYQAKRDAANTELALAKSLTEKATAELSSQKEHFKQWETKMNMQMGVVKQDDATRLQEEKNDIQSADIMLKDRQASQETPSE